VTSRKLRFVSKTQGIPQRSEESASLGKRERREQRGKRKGKEKR
jgi:hypothetical protein